MRCSQFKIDGKREFGFTHFACSVSHAATTPARAPLAPRAVVCSFPCRTCAIRDVTEPTTPEARYTSRKLPRPISSCTVQTTITLSQPRLDSAYRKSGEKLTPRSKEPQNHHVRGEVFECLMAKDTPYHTQRVRVCSDAEKVAIEQLPCWGELPQHEHANIDADE